MPINGLTKKFSKVYQFCNGDTNKFILLLRKGLYPYKHIDSWERFNETSLPDKKAFYSEFSLEDISDKDYTQAQKVLKELKLKNLCDTLIILADVFENFRNKCMKIYERNRAHFLPAPGLAWQVCLKRTGVRLKLLTDIDMLLKVEKRIKDRICHAIHMYAKANNKYMKYYNKNIES